MGIYEDMQIKMIVFKKDSSVRNSGEYNANASI